MIEEDKIKQEVFHSYFGKRVIIYPVSKNGQNVNSYLSINDGRFVKHYETLKQKYGFKRSWLDLQSEYIFQAWEAINKFTPETGMAGWKNILNRTDNHEENKLISYIKKTVTFKMYEFVNPNAFRTTTTEEGKRIHYTLVLEFESLDELLTCEIDNEGAPPIHLTGENNIFNNTMYYYYITHFQKWFEENRDTILAKTQVEFLDNLRKCSKRPHLTPSEFEETTGVRWSDYSRRLRRIEDRIYKAWEKDKPISQSRKQVNNSSKIQYFQEYMDIVNDTSSLLSQNLQLTNHLIKGMDDLKVEYDVFEVTNTLKGAKRVQFNRLVQQKNHRNVALAADSLYKLTVEVENKLKRLLKGQKVVVEDKKLPSVEPKKSKKTKRTMVTTYDLEGNLKQVEYKIDKDPLKHKNIYYVLPTGVHTQQR